MEASSRSGAPMVRNETSSPRPGEAQGERVKCLSSPTQALPDSYLVAPQEWRPQPALGLPELRTCSHAKPPFLWGYPEPCSFCIILLSCLSLTLDLLLEVLLFLSTLFSPDLLPTGSSGQT